MNDFVDLGGPEYISGGVVSKPSHGSRLDRLLCGESLKGFEKKWKKSGDM